MNPTRIIDRLDLMIDDLLEECDLASSSLASILIAARESLSGGYHVPLARKVWDANESLKNVVPRMDYPEISSCGTDG